VAGLEKEIKQDGRQGDAERRYEDCRSLRGERMFEGVSKKIETEEEEKYGEEADQTSEGSRQPSANDQGLDDMVSGAAH
jgi:hypothetical protein